MKPLDVIIVGGGLSGLSAAYTLRNDPRFQVTILEERDRLGGRTTSTTLGKTAVDVGGFIIYPWYETFRAISRELGIDHAIKNLPELTIFYAIFQDPLFYSAEELAPSLREKIHLATKLLPAFRKNFDVSRPNLTRTNEKSVEDFFKESTSEEFLRYIDTVCQGYCYPPIASYRASFLLPMMANNIFSGDVRSSAYFPKGISTLITALQRELLTCGVRLHTGEKVHKRQGKKLITSKQILVPDAVILSHPLPEDGIRYTSFLTITLTTERKAKLPKKPSWGALFLHPDVHRFVRITSIINTEKLYKGAKNTLTVNILIEDFEEMPKQNVAFMRRLTRELSRIFGDIGEATITSWTPWHHTMPQSTEDAVATFLKHQGDDMVFYAGDMLGCPSMETALRTGISAAKQLQERVTLFQKNTPND